MSGEPAANLVESLVAEIEVLRLRIRLYFIACGRGPANRDDGEIQAAAAELVAAVMPRSSTQPKEVPMRNWLVLANYNADGSMCADLGDRRGLGVVAMFRSADEDVPLPGDVSEALDGYSLSEPHELIFVPLDVAHTAMVQRSSTVEIISRGGPVV